MFTMTIQFDTREQMDALLEVLHSDEANDILEGPFFDEGLKITLPDPADMD